MKSTQLCDTSLGGRATGCLQSSSHQLLVENCSCGRALTCLIPLWWTHSRLKLPERWSGDISSRCWVNPTTNTSSFLQSLVSCCGEVWDDMGGNSLIMQNIMDIKSSSPFYKFPKDKTELTYQSAFVITTWITSIVTRMAWLLAQVWCPGVVLSIQ